MNANLATVYRLLVGLSLAILAGCTNFDREWQNFSQTPATGIEGRWQGSWKSEADGHNGALLCVIRHSGGDIYTTSFSATYASIFHFAYDAKLTGHQAGDVVKLTGDENLGWPVGVYHYEGTAGPAQFYCTYRSQDDHGYFALARPGVTPVTQPASSGQ